MGGWAYKTSLIAPFFIEVPVPVPSQEKKQSCIYVC